MRRLALTVLFSLAAASGLACADVYTWTDAKGVLNVSNLAPPDGARVACNVGLRHGQRARVPCGDYEAFLYVHGAELKPLGWRASVSRGTDAVFSRAR